MFGRKKLKLKNKKILIPRFISHDRKSVPLLHHVKIV